ncbi:hypothetical protein SLEP1_g55808 [Rubroshorea leprosula]|uniref:Uncharacterized protein n=1 Tax=Rubroshorea leprosula TaxID=152421 RepID=A0AAV5MGM5_9ROSI|nr:hypothetical protein SLEP1_g55808 [Rubroshorea leprosula]
MVKGNRKRSVGEKVPIVMFCLLQSYEVPPSKAGNKTSRGSALKVKA